MNRKFNKERLSDTNKKDRKNLSSSQSQDGQNKSDSFNSVKTIIQTCENVIPSKEEIEEKLNLIRISDNNFNPGDSSSGFTSKTKVKKTKTTDNSEVESTQKSYSLIKELEEDYRIDPKDMYYPDKTKCVPSSKYPMPKLNLGSNKSINQEESIHNFKTNARTTSFENSDGKLINQDELKENQSISNNDTNSLGKIYS